MGTQQHPTPSGSSRLEPTHSRRKAASCALGTAIYHLPLLAGSMRAMGTRSTLRGEDGVLVALPSLCFPFAPAVSKRSFSLWWWPLCFVCVHLSSSESAAPRFVPSSPPAPIWLRLCLSNRLCYLCLSLSQPDVDDEAVVRTPFLSGVCVLVSPLSSCCQRVVQAALVLPHPRGWFLPRGIASPWLGGPACCSGAAQGVGSARPEAFIGSSPLGPQG